MNLAKGTLFADRYEIGNAISVDASEGDIYLATDKAEGGRQVVVKVFERSNEYPRWPTTKLLEELMENSIKVGTALVEADKELFVEVIEIVREIGGQVAMVMEYMDGGDLADYLRDLNDSEEFECDISECLYILMRIAQALEVMHSKGIIYRDLKPENVLLDKGRGIVKLCDFSTAMGKSLSPGVGNIEFLTPGYAAPEISSRSASVQSDLFALGVIMYELIISTEPPRDLRNMPDDIDEDLKQLLLKLLDSNPGSRPRSAREVAIVLARNMVMHNRELESTEPYCSILGSGGSEAH